MVWLGLQIQCIPRREEGRSIHQWILKKIEMFKGLAEFLEFAIISFFCAFWLIWKGRNEACFEKKNPNPWATFSRVNVLANDYFNHALKET